MSATVTASIDFTVTAEAEIAFAVGVARPTPLRTESLAVTRSGQPVELREVSDPWGTRHHLATIAPGRVSLRYRAEVEGPTPAMAATAEDMLLNGRPSRYCESDRFVVLAGNLFGGRRGQDLVDAVSDWVHDYLRYIPGTSGSEDSAIDTMLAGQGVCRDFAHLTTALLRAGGVPARVAAAYAPGLSPMDFHLVTEAAVDGAWQVIDTTRRAPRESLIRIATGRDAADTAFLSVLSGRVTFGPVSVSAVHHGDLPIDDHRHSVLW